MRSKRFTLLPRSALAACLGLLPLLAAPSAQAGASGKLQVGDHTIEPTDALALPGQAEIYGDEKLLKVYLTTTPMHPEAAREALDVEDAIRAQIEGDYVILTVGEKGDLKYVYAFIEETYDNFGFGAAGKLELSTQAKDRVAGRAATEKQEMLSDTPFSFDLTFDAAIVPERRARAKLPGDGGPAGRAYLAYVSAMKEGTREGLVAHGPRGLADELEASSEEDAAWRLESLQELAPEEMEVEGGEMFEGFAILTVRGEDWSGDAVEGRVKMVEDGGAWRFEVEDLEYAW